MRYLRTFNENMELAKSIINKKMSSFEKLKDLLKSNIGYIGKFTDFLMTENVPYESLVDLYNDLIELRNKNKNINISTLTYEKTLDEIIKAKNDINVNQLLSEFPSKQKQIAKNLLKNKTYFNLLLSVSKSKNKLSLISKISRYQNENDLVNALQLCSKDGLNNKEDILSYIEKSKSSVIYDKNNILIVHVSQFEDIKVLGSDTSWCILSEYMWTSYTKNRHQYIIYDFNKDEYNPKFKIGFTLNKDGVVYAAHDILDTASKDLLADTLSKYGILISDILPKKDNLDSSIKIDKDTILKINKKTKTSLILHFSENIELDLIPALTSKILDVSIDDKSDYGIKLGRDKLDAIGNCITKFFMNSEFVKKDDLKKLDKRLGDYIKVIIGLKSSILRGKFIDNKPDTSLKPSLFVKFIDYWSQLDVILAILKINIIRTPGMFVVNNTKDEYAYEAGWDKEKLKLISDKINAFYKSELFKSSIIYKNPNRSLYYDFIKRYVVYNYILDRKEIVDKKVIDELPNYAKAQYSILKLPFYLTLDNGSGTVSIDKFNVNYMIKKDYSNIRMMDSLLSFALILQHLNGFKLDFKVSKYLISQVKSKNYTCPDYLNQEYFNLAKSLFDILSSKRIGSVVEEGDIKITIV